MSKATRNVKNINPHLLQEISHPEYLGPKLGQQLYEHYASWMEVPSPSVHLKKGIEDVKSNWTSVGQNIPDILARALETDFGISRSEACRDYIMETW